MRLSYLFALMLVSPLAGADVAGSRDLDVLPRFAGSEIVTFKEEAEQERVYPQGTVRRISGRLRYEREVLVQGALTAVTYELPGTHSANEVFTQAREALQDQDAQLLYWCQGRECGSSSLWANSVFGNSTLYGSDDQQAYALLRLAEPRHDSLVALYSITRGNRRAYLHAELLKAGQPLAKVLPTPATLSRQLKSTGTLRMPERDQPSPEWAEVLARSLNLDSTLRVSLSGVNAEAWREALIDDQVRAARLEIGESTGDGLRIDVLR
ncbi:MULTISPECIES: DUF4892 domain-containing protein [Pseudomonadaceae]|uniref:DUF4892 domain-containing protein n=1 Tax=Pseudomonas straminea TaxID=47882 RepID=A0A1I1VX27_PSEOC|nr:MULTISPECIES: DUF4892 domain-containing protein [Pseudomonas]MDD1507747.1 DUF4892 domain-containing protein [Pseudomonas sp. CNPSo 3701]TWE00804.1 uncharacterized protein DUF4892 [Pseudomonas sp. AG1028]GLX14394.1 DUF4892 domain-containing protein [Pseudomonas straminea]SFD87405.1 protein of unknown function [Pseudomonas straminea]